MSGSFGAFNRHKVLPELIQLIGRVYLQAGRGLRGFRVDLAYKAVSLFPGPVAGVTVCRNSLTKCFDILC